MKLYQAEMHTGATDVSTLLLLHLSDYISKSETDIKISYIQIQSEIVHIHTRHLSVQGIFPSKNSDAMFIKIGLYLRPIHCYHKYFNDEKVHTEKCFLTVERNF